MSTTRRLVGRAIVVALAVIGVIAVAASFRPSTSTAMESSVGRSAIALRHRGCGSAPA